MRLLLIPATYLAVVVMMVNPAFAQHQTQRGATLGGLAGAVAGGLIGDHNGEAGAGAAIGGALGAVTGGLLGNAADKDAQLARQRAYEQQLYRQQSATQRHAVRTQGAVSIRDVISMSRSGLGDSLIMNQIRTRGIERTPQVSDIIAMHEQGVREGVIATMQEARVAGESDTTASYPAAAAAAASPVIIHEREVVPYYPVPRYYGPRHYHHYGHPHPRHRRGYEFRVGF